MESVCLNHRKRSLLKRNRREARDRDRDESDDGERTPRKRIDRHASNASTVTETSTPGKDDDQVPIRRFRNGSQITIVDGNGDPLLHCMICDDEPDLENTLMETATEEGWEDACKNQESDGMWKVVTAAQNGVVRGCSKHRLEANMVYSVEGEVLTEEDRTMNGLSQLDKFIIWHDYCRARVRKQKKAKRK